VTKHYNHLGNLSKYCSKPPEDDIPTRKKFSFSGKSFTSRMKRRSLDPTTRISAMLPSESTDNLDVKNEVVKPSEDKIPNFPKRPLRRLSPEDRLKSMLENESETKDR